MRVALDTNVLVYAEGEGDETRCRQARALVASLPADEVLVPVQVLGELSRVLIGKAGRLRDDVRTAVTGWADAYQVADSTAQAFASALDLMADHQMSTWDALILAVAAEHRCRTLYSEDFHAGLTWHGVTVVNPFEGSHQRY
ncbi:MAG: PIN domain-containing protein [Micrococcales bacterium]|nr:PIN domain-containing protein [Micrococcales bacterium]